MPIKTFTLCSSCEHYMPCDDYQTCNATPPCPMHSKMPLVNKTHAGPPKRTHCKCLSVAYHEECPYYEEVPTNAEET